MLRVTLLQASHQVERRHSGVTMPALVYFAGGSSWWSPFSQRFGWKAEDSVDYKDLLKAFGRQLVRPQRL